MTLRVKVIPRSSKSEIMGKMPDGAWKIKIAAPPEKGKANEALIALLARHFGVGRGNIEIVSGHGAALKLVKITGIPAE